MPASAYFVHVTERHRFEASCQISVTTFPEASRCSITFNFPPAIGYQRKPTTVTFFSRAVLWNSSPEGGVGYVEFQFHLLAPPLLAPLFVSKRIFLGDKANHRLPKSLLESLRSTKWPRYLQDRSHFRALLARRPARSLCLPVQLSRSSDIDSSTVQKSNRATLKFL